MADPDVRAVALALLAAALFGVSNLVARFGLQHADARSGAQVSIGATAALYWVLLPFVLDEVAWPAAALAVFVAVFCLVGLVSPSLSLFFAFEGNRRLGPTVSGTLASTAPLFASASAVVVLGERPGPLVAGGTLAIVAGVMVFSWRGRGAPGGPWWAVLFPLGAAFFRGNVQMGSKLGFAAIPAPFAAALITFTVSFLAVWGVNRLLGHRVALAALRGGARWFVLTGVLNGLAILGLYSALNVGRVVVVSPVVATYPLFTFAISLLLRIERLGPRIALGVALVVSGVIAISAS